MSGVAVATGNEITDATRAAALLLGIADRGQLIDEFLNDSSFGIFSSLTNIFGRGQCDLTGAIWSTTAGTTRAVDATTPPPYSTQSVKVITDGTSAGQGIVASSVSGGLSDAAGTPEVGSIWFKGVLGNSYQVGVDIINTDATTTAGTRTIFNATGAWQLITPAKVAVAVGKTADHIYIYSGINGTRAETFWVAHAMLQSNSNFVGPYVSTFGGSTSTVSEGGVSLPTNFIVPTQGFLSVRMRMYHAAGQCTDPRVAELRSDWNMFHDGTNWKMVDGASSVVQADAYAKGDLRTVTFKWTSTNLFVSVNGAAFASAARAAVGTVSEFSVGNRSSLGRALNGDIFWLAVGTSSPSDADAATINAYGGTDKTPESFASGGANLFWPANTTEYFFRGDTSYIASLGRRPVPMIQGPDIDKIMKMQVQR